MYMKEMVALTIEEMYDCLTEEEKEMVIHQIDAYIETRSSDLPHPAPLE